jgi:tetratricopeptide (TPR) repeat protein
LDVFAIQSDVAHQVAAALQATLTPAQQERIERRPTDDSEAYNLYLKGRYFFDRRGEGIWKGLEYFGQALEIDPDYALAHAGVADCHCLMGFYGYIPAREGWAEAKAAALRALEIDDGLGEAHATLAFVNVCYGWDMQAAEREFKRAIELNPGYAPAYYWYATLFTALGRWEESSRQSERALEVDPLSIFATAHYGWCLIGPRQYERAREQQKRALELEPNFAHAYWLLGWLFGMESRFEESIAHLQKALELDEHFSWSLAHLGWAYGASGRVDEACAVLSELKARRREGYVRSLYFALVHFGLGERDEALDWLEKAYEERDVWMAWLNIDGTFDSLRSEPRFEALIKKVGVA